MTMEELHVLAVDDSLVDRKVIERLLKISCCKVTAVESGRRALQFLGLDGDKSSVGFDGLKVNLILTDYSMPGMNGYELLKKIKGSSTLKKIPVVIMSSENILTRIDRCLEEGAEEFLVKPVKLDDVKRIKDFILKGEEDECGKKNSSGTRNEEEEDNRPKETRKRKKLFDAPSSLEQPLSLSPILPLARNNPVSSKSSAQACDSTRTLLSNAIDKSLACAPSTLPISAVPKESNSKRPRLETAAES